MYSLSGRRGFAEKDERFITTIQLPGSRRVPSELDYITEGYRPCDDRARGRYGTCAGCYPAFVTIVLLLLTAGCATAVCFAFFWPQRPPPMRTTTPSTLTAPPGPAVLEEMSARVMADLELAAVRFSSVLGDTTSTVARDLAGKLCEEVTATYKGSEFESMLQGCTVEKFTLLQIPKMGIENTLAHMNVKIKAKVMASGSHVQKMRKVAERFAQKLQEVVPGSRQSPGGEEAEWGKFGASVRDVRIDAIIGDPTATPATPPQESCEPIKVAACKGLKYNTTKFPNWFNMMSQDQFAASYESQVVAAVSASCPHIGARLFLCGMFVPKCKGSQKVAPCRGLCQSFLARCNVTLRRVGMAVSQFQCNNLPTSDCVGERKVVIVLKGVVKQTGLSYNKTLENKNSTYFKTLQRNFCQKINLTFTGSPLQSKLGNCTVKRFRSGSLVTEFEQQIRFTTSEGEDDQGFGESSAGAATEAAEVFTGGVDAGAPSPGGEAANWGKTGASVEEIGVEFPPGFDAPPVPLPTLRPARSSSPRPRPRPTGFPPKPPPEGGRGTGMPYIRTSGQCERLTVSSCQSLPYKSTIFPNWMLMKTQSDAEMASLGLTVLASMCTSYAHARLFMCSLVTPKCDAGRRVAPCRHFCQEFRDKCSNVLKNANVPMPFFECQQYPDVSTDPLCVQPPKDGAGSSKCEAITMDFCKSQPYKTTTFPNWFNLPTQSMAKEMGSSLAIVSSVCPYKHARYFLCSLVVPKCQGGRRIAPCRPLCEAFMGKCGYLMQNAAANVSAFNCQLYPDVAKDPSCLKAPTDGGIPGRRCQPVQPSVCNALGFQQTAFPNYFGMANADMANSIFSQYSAILQKANCYRYSQLFMCAAIYPKCTAGKLLPPCNNLCEAFVNSPCKHIAPTKEMTCSAFPVATDPAVCLGGKEGSERVLDNWCGPLTITSCGQYGYRKTMLPNYFDMVDQNDVMKRGIPMREAVIKTCPYKHTGLFLCGLLAPKCRSDGVRVPPCRRMCQDFTRAGCADAIVRFRGKAVDCEQLPDSEDPTVCMGEEQLQQPKSFCGPIEIAQCSALDYKLASFPNLVGHVTQVQVMVAFVGEEERLRRACGDRYQETVTFLCSVLAPRCNSTGGPLPPCGNYCTAMLNGCARGSRMFAKIKCESFPLSTDPKVCWSPRS